LDVGEVHQASIVFDGHCDTLLQVLDGKRRLGQRSPMGHLDLPRLKEGGVTAQVFAVFIEDVYLPAGATRQTLRVLDCFYEELDANRDAMLLATCADDVMAAVETGRVAAWLALEGAESLEGDLGVLRMLYRLGVRLLTVTWSRRNQAGDGVGELGSGGGLTTFGESLVRECNRLGVVLDISHLAPAGVRGILELSEQPVVASHSNAYALCPHPRNLTDEQLAVVARQGGVVCATFVPAFLSPRGRGASLDTLLDHIQHIEQVTGIDHVGIGSDFDGVFGPMPLGLEDASLMSGITAGLLTRGYSVSHVRQILGENLLRVFRTVAG
jgi:membrane dipeptidase